MNQFKKDFYKKISFEKDIIHNKNILSNKICNQNILVIGGAGTIGSSYIKQILKKRSFGILNSIVKKTVSSCLNKLNLLFP